MGFGRRPVRREDALLKLSLKNGDVVFVNAGTIDPTAIMSMVSPGPEQDQVEFIFVDVRPGMSLAETVQVADRATIKRILETGE